MFKILYKTLKRFLSPDKRKQLEIISLLDMVIGAKPKRLNL